MRSWRTIELYENTSSRVCIRLFNLFFAPIELHLCFLLLYFICSSARGFGLVAPLLGSDSFFNKPNGLYGLLYYTIVSLLGKYNILTPKIHWFFFAHAQKVFIWPQTSTNKRNLELLFYFAISFSLVKCSMDANHPENRNINSHTRIICRIALHSLLHSAKLFTVEAKQDPFNGSKHTSTQQWENKGVKSAGTKYFSDKCTMHSNTCA